jgi:hypothetical protein
VYIAYAKKIMPGSLRSSGNGYKVNYNNALKAGYIAPKNSVIKKVEGKIL